MPEKLDGKYEVKREISHDAAVRSVEVTAVDGRAVRLDWFFVTDPKSRSAFHRYRTALKTNNSPLMLDAVARPGAYYTVWQLETGASAKDWLEAHPKDESFRQRLVDIAGSLETFGFALSDSDVIAVEHRENGKAEVRPALANLRLSEHSAEEIKKLNLALLEPNKSTAKITPTVKTNKKTVATQNLVNSNTVSKPTPTSFQRRLTIWGIIPGIALLVGTGLFGQQAVQAFLQPAMVTVPNVVGKSAHEAAKILSETRLSTKVEVGNDSSQPDGVVLSQNPAKGASLTETRVVIIVINHPRPLIAPDLVGKLGSEAKTSLKEMGLVVARVAIVPAAEGQPRGVVLAQNPIPGTQMLKGGSITILVSGSRPEPGKTFIPDLTGLTFTEAREIIKLSGLTLVEIKTRNSTVAKNTVLEQTPAPNKSVLLEGEATLTIATTTNAQRPIVPEPIRVQPVVTIPTPQPAVVAPQPVETPTTPVQTPSTPVAAPTQPESPAPTPVTPTPALPEGQKPPVETPTPAPTPTTPPIETPTNTTSVTRSVTFSYVVPADLGTVTLEIRMSDDDGIKTVYGPLTVPAGQPIEISKEVRGKATFTVIINGSQLYAEDK